MLSIYFFIYSNGLAQNLIIQQIRVSVSYEMEALENFMLVFPDICALFTAILDNLKISPPSNPNKCKFKVVKCCTLHRTTLVTDSDMKDFYIKCCILVQELFYSKNLCYSSLLASSPLLKASKIYILIKCI